MKRNYYKHQAIRVGKRFWVLLLISIPLASILLFAATPGFSLLSDLITQKSSKLRTAYRYKFSPSLPGTTNPVSEVQREITFYQERIRTDPQGGLNLALLARAYLKMARATGETSWYLLAEQAAERSLANLPFNNNGAVLTLARVAEARHDFPEAIRLAGEVMRTQPSNEDAIAIMVTSNLALGKLAAASKEADTLVNKIPTLGSLTLRAIVKVAQGQDRVAVQDFQAALATEEAGETGSSAWTRTLLGQFYAKRGQLTLAGELYHEALRILPRYPLALVQLAELETRLGQYKAAESHYDQVIAYSRESATIYDHVVLRGKARLKELQGDSDASTLRNQAEALLRQQTAAGHGSGSFGHRRELARLLIERGQPQDVTEALSLMQAEVGIRRDAQTLDTLAWALSSSGRFSEAQRIMQEALRSGIRDPGMFYRCGEIAQALGNQSAAIAFWQKAQQTDPMFDKQAQQALGLGLGFGY